VKDGRDKKIAFEAKVEANFINPIIKFDKQVVEFNYVWSKDNEPNKIYLPVQVISNCPLETEFKLNTKEPFGIDHE